MTKKQYNQLITHIEKYHTWGNGKMVTYVDSMYDARTGTYFTLRLRGAFGEWTLSTVNEDRDRDLFLEAMDFLEYNNPARQPSSSKTKELAS